MLIKTILCLWFRWLGLWFLEPPAGRKDCPDYQYFCQCLLLEIWLQNESKRFDLLVLVNANLILCPDQVLYLCSHMSHLTWYLPLTLTVTATEKYWEKNNFFVLKNMAKKTFLGPIPFLLRFYLRIQEKPETWFCIMFSYLN